MTNPWKEPIAACPYCSSECRADWCSVLDGPYEVQVGPFYCENCGASQIGPHDKSRVLTEEERKFGWYGPNTELGSSVNRVGNIPVSAALAKDLYKIETQFGVKILAPIETETEKECEDD